jgi:hypothetical protein
MTAKVAARSAGYLFNPWVPAAAFDRQMMTFQGEEEKIIWIRTDF